MAPWRLPFWFYVSSAQETLMRQISQLFIWLTGKLTCWPDVLFLDLFDIARVYHWPRATSICGRLAWTSNLVLVTTSSVVLAEAIERSRTHRHYQPQDARSVVLPSHLQSLQSWTCLISFLCFFSHCVSADLRKTVIWAFTFVPWIFLFLDLWDCLVVYIGYHNIKLITHSM